ncbi:helix-turn-helix transcriptional regulator [Sanguibacter antarcticus]|uniref:DNA-binding NarL/FixJ family response regulator n=1 Tax=Sanguibacter antarcticus TaxID=372484 RepID=A0A2A9E6W4_9MICO|nr:helix-turn-helix transcriptional regulator [Sanguibacter antarcticus]PFG34291.1 DNA-binding NarL/FixJ family response regulator [Sanguibacter antarcticus]
MTISQPHGSGVGRPVPLASLTSEVEHALAAVGRGRGGYIWTAPPGAGKSTLLDLVRESAAARGPSHALVHLQPSTDGAGAVTEHLVAQLVRTCAVPVPTHLAAALSRPSTGERPDAACSALVEYAHAALPDTTVVLLVDDLDLLDPASRSLLLYLVTHHQMSVVLLATATHARWAVHLPYPLSLRKIPPLTPDEVLHLLGAQEHLTTAPRVAATLARTLSGNTACILQTALELSPAQLAGTSLLPNPLPPVPALESVHGPTLDLLDADARRTLLVATVSVVDRTDLLLAASGCSLDTVLDGPVAELLHLAGGRFTVADPAVRAAVHGRASVAERTSAHLALAAAHQEAGLDDTATWHTALGSLAGDPDLAPALVDIAERLLASGDVVHAHEVAREAASQSTGASATRAHLVAGIAALRSGHVVDADGWLQQVVRSTDPELTSQALAPYVTAVTLHTGRVPDDDVVQHVGSPLWSGTVAHRCALIEALSTTARLHAERGHLDTAAEYLHATHEALAALEQDEPSPPVTCSTPVDAGAAGAADEPARRAAAAHLTELVRLDTGWCTLFGVGPVVAFTDHGTGAEQPTTLPADPLLLGHHTSAPLSPETHPDQQTSARALRAFQHVLAGDLETAQSSLASAAVTHAPVHDDGTWRSAPGTAVSPLAEALLRAARVLVSLACADLDVAADELARAAFHVPVDLPVAGIAVAAARRLDVFRLDDASEIALALAAATPAPPSASVRRESLVDTLLLAERTGTWCEASATLEMLAGTGLAPWGALLPGLHDEAGSGRPQHPLTAASFQHARDQLAAARTAVHARARAGTGPSVHELLLSAADLFETCGAHAWRTAALAESEAAARPAPFPVPVRAAPEQQVAPGSVPWGAALTRRELDVALLVVQGASNRDVARALTVSVRTVEVHLGRVFRKLGARSRVELTVLAHRDHRRTTARSS